MALCPPSATNVPASASRAAPAGQLSKAGTRGMTSCRESSGASRLVIIGRDVVWYLPDGKAYSPSGSVRMPFDYGLQAFCASRGLIEFLIRRRTTAIPNIRFESGCAVRGLLCRDGMVRGVRCADARSVGADLVVDATGRGHRAREWLEAIGFRAPEETEIGLDTAYSTATFRRPEGLDCEPVVFITGPAPQFTRRGYVIAIENGTWLVSLIGRFGDFPPTDAQGFRAFARELHSDLACRIIEMPSSSARSFTTASSAACSATTSACMRFPKVSWPSAMRSAPSIRSTRRA